MHSQDGPANLHGHDHNSSAHASLPHAMKGETQVLNVPARYMHAAVYAFTHATAMTHSDVSCCGADAK